MRQFKNICSYYTCFGVELQEKYFVFAGFGGTGTAWKEWLRRSRFSFPSVVYEIEWYAVDEVCV
jgi:hypothetical protein